MSLRLSLTLSLGLVVLAALGLTLRDRARAVRRAPSGHERPRSNATGSRQPVSSTANRASFTFVARDLADGNGIPALALEVHGTDAKGSKRQTTVVTDGRGHAEVRLASVSTLKSLGKAWSQPRKPSRPPPGDDVWFYKQVIVSGRIIDGLDRKDFDPTAVKLDGIAIGAGRVGGALGPDPWNLNWFMRHRVQVTRGLPRPRKDGSFEVTLPRIRGMHIRAFATGYRVAHAELPIDGTTVRTEVLLVLKRSFSINGELRNQDGRPLKGVQIRAYVTRRGQYHEISFERAQLMGRPYGAEASKVENEATETFAYVATTDAHGRYQLDLHLEGDVQVFAWVRGHRFVATDLGVVAGDRKDVSLVATQVRDSRRVVFTAKGQPLRRCGMVIADVSRTAEPAIEVILDEDGAFPTEWLEVGRAYQFINIRGRLPAGVRRPLLGQLLWDDRKTIEMTELPRRAR